MRIKAVKSGLTYNTFRLLTVHTGGYNKPLLFTVIFQACHLMDDVMYRVVNAIKGNALLTW